jgi:hypothetical protein
MGLAQAGDPPQAARRCPGMARRWPGASPKPGAAHAEAARKTPARPEHNGTKPVPHRRKGNEVTGRDAARRELGAGETTDGVGVGRVSLARTRARPVVDITDGAALAWENIDQPYSRIPHGQ